MKKQLQLFLVLTCMLLPGIQSAKGQTPKRNHLVVYTDLPRLTMLSSNAKWAAGFTPGGGCSYVVNLQTEEVFIIDNDSNTDIYGISDEGMVVGAAFGFPAIWTLDGKMTPLPMSEGEIFGSAHAITPDGRYIIGTMGGFVNGVPVRWTIQNDGSYGLPEMLMTPDKDFFGKKPDGYCADIISSDGSMIAGRLVDNEYAWFPVLWKNIEVTPEPTIFGVEWMVEEGRWNGARSSLATFTADDKYIVGIFNMGDGIIKNWLYNIEENKTETLNLSGEIICLHTTDGKTISASPGVYLYRSAFIDIPGRDGMTLEDYVQENFGLNMLKEMDRSGTPMAISADDKTIVGFSAHRSGPMVAYSLQMGIDPTGIKATPTEKPKVYADADGRIIVNGAQGATVTLSDTSGKILSSVVASPDAIIPAQEGIYIVKVALPSVSFINKVVVNKN